MRAMQRRSAESRWGGLSAAERSARMKALRAKAERKPKRVARRSNKKYAFIARKTDGSVWYVETYGVGETLISAETQLFNATK
jgi:hypothetical protein